MSTQSKRKAPEELFTYSWYFPVPGEEVPGQSPPPAEPAPVEAQAPAPVPTPVVIRSVRDVKRARSAPKPRSNFHVSLSTVRIAGIAGWSVAAGGGVVALLATQSPAPVGNLIAVCGLWGGISAIVYFLPGKLMK